MWRLGGHLGAQVSALVDGQLDPDAAERAWRHTLRCPSCRRLVVREGWVKHRLRAISREVHDAPPERLLGSLHGLGTDEPAWDGPTCPESTWDDPSWHPRWQDNDSPATAWEQDGWPELEGERSRTVWGRRAGLTLAGAGSVSAAVLGFTTVTATPMQINTPGSPAATSLSRAVSSTPTRAMVGPAAATVHGRLRGWTIGGSGEGDVTRARAVSLRR